MPISIAGPYVQQTEVLLSTLTLSGVADFTTAALPVYGSYKIIFQNIVCNQATTINMTVNSVGGTAYSGKSLTNAAVTTFTGSSIWILCTSAQTTDSVTGCFYLTGASPVIASGTVNFFGSCTPLQTQTQAVSGACILGSGVQVSTLQFLRGAGSWTGTIKVYGVL